MNTEALLEKLAAKGVRFERDGDELVVDGPDEAMTDELIAEIRAHKPALMAAASKSDARRGGPQLHPIAEGEPMPLSFAQQRIWYLEQLESGKATYNLPFAYRITGALDPAALERCLELIVSRHSILRATYVVTDGAPVHRFDDSLGIGFEIRSFEAAEVNDEMLQNLLLPLATKPFDLERGPLFRATLVELGADDWVLLFVAHHTIFDGASIEILEREIATFYPDVSADGDVDHPGPALQFVDYAAWQTKHLSGDRLERLVEHWMSRISGEHAPLNLPIDRPYPAEQTYNGGRVYGVLGQDDVLALRAVAKDNKATLFMVLIAAFLVALRRFCGDEDVTIGFPVANRTETECEELIGFFANTLPLRVDVDDGQTLKDLLGVVRDSVIDCIAHSELPFEKLVEALNPPRDLARSPVFQALVSYQEGVSLRFTAGDLSFERMRVPLPVSRLDVSLFATESANELDLVLEFNTDVFEDASADRLLQCVSSVLTSIAGQPQATIGDLDLLLDDEADRLIKDSHGTDRDWAPYRIEALIDKTRPGSIAIRDDERTVSYGELASLSDSVAGDLRARGVGEGDLVGIYMHRSHQMLVAMLGVMKAGAGYVPLDPEFPSDRLAYMLRDCAASIVITQPDLAASLPETDGQVVTYEQCIANAGGGPSGSASYSADSVAYVLYTSGSTGWPKGVVVPHRCVTNFLKSMAEHPGLGPDDVLLSVTTASFDISVLEFFLPLVVGGTVVIASVEELSDSDSFIDLLRDSGATAMQATPSTWRMLIEAGWEGDHGLKALCGGEALPDDLARELLPRCRELWNMYGPTETTIWSTCQRIDDADRPITIGTPIANTRVYVLDERKRPVPIGVHGEIWIGGDGVSDGYLNQPGLTADSFVTDPFSERDGARMYRTGDVGRWRHDGTLQHLGRIGGQVKIRGYRIELGEIESVLRSHDRIAAAACQVWEASPGDQRLVAHFVPSGGDEVPSTELRKFLRKRLPDYMIPQHFEAATEIPLTPNGKIDRAALDAPSVGGQAARSVMPPETDAEKVIADIWKELIGTDVVGRHDFFFDLGGHSLLAVRAASEIEAQLGRRPHLREFILNDLAEIAGRSGATEDLDESAETRKGGLISRLLGRP